LCEELANVYKSKILYENLGRILVSETNARNCYCFILVVGELLRDSVIWHCWVGNWKVSRPVKPASVISKGSFWDLAQPKVTPEKKVSQTKSDSYSSSCILHHHHHHRLTALIQVNLR